MKKTVILLLPILLFAVSTAAVDLDTYPIPFIDGGSFTAQIIVGAAAPSTDVLAATDIAVSLQQQSNTRISARMDDEFDIQKNGILIGLPCHNTAVAKVLGTKECYIGLANNTGYLKLVEKDGQTFLIVTGKAPADTRKAARLLAQSESHTLSGTDAIVTGTLDEPEVGKATQPLQPQPETPQDGCKTDADCLESEYCLAETCKDLGCPEGTKAQGHDCAAATQKIAEIGGTQEQPTPAKAEANATAAQPESKAAGKVAPVTSDKKSGFIAKILSFFRNFLR